MRTRSFLCLISLFCLLWPDSASAARTISMDFEEAALKDVLKVFSQQSGLNFVASQDIETKKVTVYMENVSVKEALDSLIKANNLFYRQKSGSQVFIVYGLTEENLHQVLETRVFHLKHMRLSVSPLDVGGQSVIDDLKKKEEFGGSSGGGSSEEESSDEGSGGDSGESQGGSASTALNNLSAGKGADKLVASLISKNGKVTVDIHSNSLIVTETPERLDQIAGVLAKLDVPPTQAMIEVYLMEVKKSIADDLGVDWGGSSGALLSFTGGSRTTGFPFTENFLNENQGVKATTQGTSTLTLGTLSAANFTATLRFLTSQSDTKILARPRVLTINNEAAQIKLVTNAAIANTTTTAASEGIATTTSNQADRTEVGISLKMTPQINEDASIELFLEPAVTTVATSTLSSSFLDPTTRTIRTIARVKNHETLVIGGLIDSDKGLVRKKIPFLGDIPIAGKMFHYDNGDYLDRELLIFITPHIVESYDSVRGENASAEGKEYAIERLRPNFEADEWARTLKPHQNRDKGSEMLFREQRVLIDTRQRVATAKPNLDQKISQALDKFNSK